MHGAFHANKVREYEGYTSDTHQGQHGETIYLVRIPTSCNRHGPRVTAKQTIFFDYAKKREHLCSKLCAILPLVLPTAVLTSHLHHAWLRFSYVTSWICLHEQPSSLVNSPCVPPLSSEVHRPGRLRLGALALAPLHSLNCDWTPLPSTRSRKGFLIFGWILLSKRTALLSKRKIWRLNLSLGSLLWAILKEVDG